MENRKRITGKAIVRWLYAEDDPECYIRPVDVVMSSAEGVLFLSLSLLDTPPTWKELLSFMFWGCLSFSTVWLAGCWVLKTRTFE